MVCAPSRPDLASSSFLSFGSELHSEILRFLLQNWNSIPSKFFYLGRAAPSYWVAAGPLRRTIGEGSDLGPGPSIGPGAYRLVLGPSIWPKAFRLGRGRSTSWPKARPSTANTSSLNLHTTHTRGRSPRGWWHPRVGSLCDHDTGMSTPHSVHFCTQQGSPLTG